MKKLNYKTAEMFIRMIRREGITVNFKAKTITLYDQLDCVITKSRIAELKKRNGFKVYTQLSLF